MQYRYVNQKWMDKPELIEIAKSAGALTLAFSLFYFIHNRSLLNAISWYELIFVTLLSIAGGFILHELAHKYFAIKFGADAKYSGDDKMLILAIIGGIIGFIFAAPGAVVIRGNLNKNRLGIISFAGPFSNFLLVALFAVLAFIYPPFILGSVVNTWIGAFNLIPLAPFDGQKIFRWNKFAYFGLVIIALWMLSIFVF